MKKILLLADINSPHTQRWLHAIASHPRLQITVFSLTTRTVEVPSSINVFTADLNSQFARKQNAAIKMGGYMKSLPQLRRIIKQFQPDVVHAMYASSYGLLGALVNAKVFYVSGWGTDVFSFPKKNILTKSVLQFVFSRAGRLYSTSNFMANEMNLYTTKPIHVIPYGVDTLTFSPIENTANSFREITIGTIKSHEPTYGIDVLIKAFALLRKNLGQRSIKLLLVGQGSQTESLTQLTAQLGIENHVTFTGHVSHEHVAEMHRLIDIFVAPTIHESFGVALLEAMSTAKPCVVSDIQAYREIDGNSRALRFFNVGNANELSQILHDLLNDPDQCKRLGGKAREHVLNYYDAAKIESTIVNEYLLDK